MNKLLFAAAMAAFISCNDSGETTVTKTDSTHNRDSMSTTSQHNALSDSENKDGWKLLFDGQSLNGWHSYGRTAPGKAWKAQDGNIFLDTTNKKDWQVSDGGDLVTNEEFENFHLKLEWKLAPKGNSGIIFYIHEDSVKYEHTWHTGPEMQVLDNAGHNDASIQKHQAGDLYDLISSSKQTVKPAGEWNQVEIIANKGKLDFHLNGENIISTTMWDDNWKKMVANSKFKDKPGFGIFKRGKIALQDHGDMVWYRNIKIKAL